MVVVDSGDGNGRDSVRGRASDVVMIVVIELARETTKYKCVVFVREGRENRKVKCEARR